MHTPNLKNCFTPSMGDQSVRRSSAKVVASSEMSTGFSRSQAEGRVQSLVDPLTDYYMITPLKCSDSQTYDKATLDVLTFQSKGAPGGLRSPYTRLPLTSQGIDWAILRKTRSVPSVRFRLEPFSILENISLFDAALDGAEAWVKRCRSQKIGSPLFSLACNELRDRGWLLIAEISSSFSEIICEQLAFFTFNHKDPSILLPLRIACAKQIEASSDELAREICEMVGLIKVREEQSDRGEIIFHLIKSAYAGEETASLDSNLCGLMAMEGLLPWLEKADAAGWDINKFPVEDIFWIEKLSVFGLEYTSHKGWKTFLHEMIFSIHMAQISKIMDTNQKKALVELQERYDRFGVIMICDSWSWLQPKNLI